MSLHVGPGRFAKRTTRKYVLFISGIKVWLIWIKCPMWSNPPWESEDIIHLRIIAVIDESVPISITPFHQSSSRVSSELVPDSSPVLSLFPWAKLVGVRNQSTAELEPRTRSVWRLGQITRAVEIRSLSRPVLRSSTTRSPVVFIPAFRSDHYILEATVFISDHKWNPIERAPVENGKWLNDSNMYSYKAFMVNN